MGIIKIESSSHYYDINGLPMYDATMRDAKKHGYVPSVTTIFKIIAKVGLDIWKQEQLLLSALTTPRKDGISDKEFIDSIVDESRKEGFEAAAFGSAMHKLIENYILGLAIEPTNDREVNSFDAVRENLLDKYLLKGISEKTFASKEYGFGGMCDWFGELKDGSIAVVDWKSQKIKWKTFKRPTDDPFEIQVEEGYRRPKINFYPEWLMQLAGLKILIEENEGIKIDKFVSGVFNSDPEHPDVVVWKEYPAEDIANAEKTFLSLLSFWQYYHKFGGK